MGEIDILHNNAGGSTHYKDKRGFVNATSDQWDQIVGLNLRAVADCTRAVITDMKEKGAGRVIITASEMAFRGGPGFTEYSSAKAGVLGFTRSLAMEVGKYGITVNAICPGVIRTPALDSFPEQAIHATIAEILVQRLGEPEDIANAVSFLASELHHWNVITRNRWMNNALIDRTRNTYRIISSVRTRSINSISVIQEQTMIKIYPQRQHQVSADKIRN